MSTKLKNVDAATMNADLSEFLERNVGIPDGGWPLVGTSGAAEQLDSEHPGSLAGLRVLIVGDLSLEMPIEVAGTRREFLAALARYHTGRRIRWAASELRVGGFVARAARSARALGAHVSVCAVVPAPMPDRLERFLSENRIDRSLLTAVPGPMPLTMHFRCRDGAIEKQMRPGLHSIDPNPGRADGNAFDAILIDTSRLQFDRPAPGGTSFSFQGGTHRPTVAQRWSRGPCRDSGRQFGTDRTWTFVRYRDAVGLATGRANGHCRSAGRLVKHLHDRHRVAKLVLHDGRRGAVLMNGIPCPYRIHTCPLDRADIPGAGDILLTATALSSASGANDRTSIRRGVAAATGLVAGLPLPSSLEELDAGEDGAVSAGRSKCTRVPDIPSINDARPRICAADSNGSLE